MTTKIDIANMALANIGDAATVSSIDPPEGSPQADHCARFYETALKGLLESHPFSFASRRVALAALTAPIQTEWAYTYARPSDCLNAIAVLPPDATDDYSEPGRYSVYYVVEGYPWGYYTPQPFTCETDSAGHQVIYTNQESAVLRYTAYVDDPTVYPGVFVTALSWALSALIAGPILRGSAGAKTTMQAQQMATYWAAQARSMDANQQNQQVLHNVPWVQARS